MQQVDNLRDLVTACIGKVTFDTDNWDQNPVASGGKETLGKQ